MQHQSHAIWNPRFGQQALREELIFDFDYDKDTTSFDHRKALTVAALFSVFRFTHIPFFRPNSYHLLLVRLSTGSSAAEVPPPATAMATSCSASLNLA